MINVATGRYWDLPWSLVDGCTPCSPGCDHCWAAGMAQRFHKQRLGGEAEKGIVSLTTGGIFNGTILTHPERLSIPLKRRKRTVYACWNDLFHDQVTFEFVLAALAHAVGRYDLHKYLILTKRPARMVEFFKWMDSKAPYRVEMSRACWYWGLTICNQQEADEKIPVFLQVPGKKFLSLEPLLGPVDIHLDSWPMRKDCGSVILGGETGPGARPMHPDWVRSVRDQCAEAEVPFFFKTWGEWFPVYDRDKDDPDFRKCDGVKLITPQGRWLNRAGGQGFHGARVMRVDRIGKKRAGRLLDGQTHDELPWVG